MNSLHNQPTSPPWPAIAKPEVVMAMQPCAGTRVYSALVGRLMLADARLINPPNRQLIDDDSRIAAWKNGPQWAD